MKATHLPHFPYTPHPTPYTLSLPLHPTPYTPKKKGSQRSPARIDTRGLAAVQKVYFY
ncbi:MAG: hypothetical protein F6J93_39605 [Oscillatoria sp. SIO1A7]|nr:hypothetical protein [Oscillatoria sp. SIO1A7]